MRLLCEGDVGTPVIFEHSRVLTGLGTTQSLSAPNDQRVRSGGPKYILTREENDLILLQTILTALHSLNTPQAGKGKQKPSRELTVALRRFNQAYGRDLREDRIIDLTVALERCLLPDTREELSYKFALRGTAFLVWTKANKWDPHTGHALLRAMYEARSKIVHEGKQLTDIEEKLKDLQDMGIQLNDFPQQCENIVRDILRAYVLQVASGNSVKDIATGLDRYIVDGLAALFVKEIQA